MNSISALFEGRIGRAHFAWTCLAFLAAMIALNILTYALSLLGDPLGMLASLISFVAYVALGVIGLGVSVRRYHDMDWSGWFVLLGFIPIVNFVMLLVLLFKQGTAGSNRFGEPFPKSATLENAIKNRRHGAPAAHAPKQETRTAAASAEAAQDSDGPADAS